MSATNLPSGNLAQGRGDRYRWIVLGVAALAQTTASITAQGIYTLIPSLQTAFHLSEGAGALSVSALNGGQVVTMLMLGWLIDRFGERYVVAFTMVTMGLSALAGAVVSPSYLVLLLFFVLVGTSYASVQPGGTRAIVRWFPPNERGMATGVRQAGLPLGTALAAMVLPLMAATYSWRAALMLQGRSASREEYCSDCCIVTSATFPARRPPRRRTCSRP